MVSTSVHLSVCIWFCMDLCPCTNVCVNVPTYAQLLKVCVYICSKCVWSVVRDGGGAAPLTQPLCHADISRVEEIITLCSS